MPSTHRITYPGGNIQLAPLQCHHSDAASKHKVYIQDVCTVWYTHVYMLSGPSLAHDLGKMGAVGCCVYSVSLMQRSSLDGSLPPSHDGAQHPPGSISAPGPASP